MRSMTDEGFVWLDDSPAHSRALVRIEVAAASNCPVEDERVGSSTECSLHEERVRAVSRWEPPAPRRVASGLSSLASAAFRGRRAFIGACLELTDIVALELRRALTVA